MTNESKKGTEKRERTCAKEVQVKKSSYSQLACSKKYTYGNKSLAQNFSSVSRNRQKSVIFKMRRSPLICPVELFRCLSVCCLFATQFPL